VMWNTVTGNKNGQKVRVDYYMWEQADTELGVSGMARVTGFPCAITAKLIGAGKITAKGIVAPEDCIEGPVYDEFMAELEKRNINILEELGVVEA